MTRTASKTVQSGVGTARDVAYALEEVDVRP